MPRRGRNSREVLRDFESIETTDKNVIVNARVPGIRTTRDRTAVDVSDTDMPFLGSTFPLKSKAAD